MNKIFLVILSCVLMSGCSALKVETEPVDKPVLGIKDPEPLELERFDVITITKDNIESVFKELEAKGLKPVIIGFSGQDFKFLVVDLNLLKNYIELQKEILRQYREYYEPKK